jgi:hypothetical protein
MACGSSEPSVTGRDRPCPCLTLAVWTQRGSSAGQDRAMPYACWIVRSCAASAFAASAADSSAKYSSSPPGVTIKQRRRRTTYGPEDVRQVARQEHKRPRPGPEPVLAALDVQGPREDVEALVLAAVGVPGRAAVDCDSQ